MIHQWEKDWKEIEKMLLTCNPPQKVEEYMETHEEQELITALTEEEWEQKPWITIHFV